jgi:adenylate cyclase
MLEIERKFLVRGDSWRGQVSPGKYIRQGYIARSGTSQVRIRIKGSTAFLTVKGKRIGATRPEYEIPIPMEYATEMLSTMCDVPPIEKTRYELQVDDLLFEIDEFHGANDPLVLAEVELPSEATKIPKLEWLGKEVTYDDKYYSASLSRYPYSTWRDDRPVE